MLTILLLPVFFLFVAGAIYLIQRKYIHALTLTETSVAVAAKILFGCLYGLIFKLYYDGDDTWIINQASIMETELLLNDPRQFFYEFTPLSAYSYGGNSIGTIGLFFNDLEYCLLAKVLGITNLLTGGNYYLNAAVFSFISFWGHWWVYRFMCNEFPQHRKWIYYFVFFFPPALFWLSGIRSDAYLFFFTGLLLLSMQTFMLTGRLRSGMMVLASILGMAVFRIAFPVAFIPAIVAWWLCNKTNRRFGIFVSVYSGAVVFFFLTGLLPDYNLPASFASKQHDFLSLVGTRFHLPELSDSILSYLRVLPYSIANTFFRPFLWEWKGPLQLMASLQVIAFWLIICRCLISIMKKRNSLTIPPSIIAVLFASISLYLIIGFLVPFPGAIVRYKAIPELLIAGVFIFKSLNVKTY